MGPGAAKRTAGAAPIPAAPGGPTEDCMEGAAITTRAAGPCIGMGRPAGAAMPVERVDPIGGVALGANPLDTKEKGCREDVAL